MAWLWKLKRRGPHSGSETILKVLRVSGMALEVEKAWPSFRF